MMEHSPPVSLALDELGVPHTVFRHPGQVNSLEQAAQERHQHVEQVVRSILFRLSADEYLMVLAAGPGQISWKALRRYLGQSRLTLAREEEVWAVTGYRIGTVAPFGMPRPIRILIEERVLKEDEISIGSGMRNVGVILKSADLRRALSNAEVVSLAAE
ncbi:MAG TPA: YbaK/EbsC family protein [Anaerolineales bacterium]|nr:YbaK/EbsC family protein [Anaerolineales bacterium]